MREDKRKHRGKAKRQKGMKDGEEKRRENVRFITRQLRSAFIIHSVLFCPRRPGKCGEKHTSSRLSEIFCLNSEVCIMSDFDLKRNSLQLRLRSLTSERRGTSETGIKARWQKHSLR